MIKPYNKAEVTFDIIREIGEDGYNSTVYLAHDHNLDAELVVKKMEKAKLRDPNEYFRESRILYMSAHPNVVPVHYACEDVDSVYIAMPYYQNGSLNSLLNARFLTVREILVYACQFLSGVHNVHSKKLIHFDIKPANVLISNTNEAVLSDFGIAKQANLVGVAGQDVFYFSIRPPEALDNDHFTTACDIYQIGLTLYRMCNGNENYYAQLERYGEPPNFDRDAFRYDLRNGRFPDRNHFLPHIPEKLRRIVKKCLDTNPDRRYEAVLDISNALAEVDGNELDWQHSVEDGKLIWKKRANGNHYTLEVDENQKSVAKKRTTKQESRIKDYCVDAIPQKTIREFLKVT
ncbi:Phage protein [Citrifermentans bremense]|uniref:Phage protein n=1 Tax=Citrifermentans bremense TaxID=60035 RepID=A0A6S6M6A2_9BACT|nr:serine/threonine-protein kinase [Citrifermentans bremense]BCG47161.1 Phage protein [Citrifermentans bremense]